MVEALSPLLPAVTEEHRHAMRGYQTMMGDIQDSEVLLAALDKFMQKEEVNAAPARRLNKTSLRRAISCFFQRPEAARSLMWVSIPEAGGLSMHPAKARQFV